MGAQAVRLSNVDIDNALKNKDFEVLFQPIFDLGNGALARVETFIRWRHESLGVLPPGAFISFFETQGRMGELTRYVLAETLDAYLGWRGPHAPGFSINLAHSDITDEAFVSHFTKLLRDRDFPADLITLECPMPMVDMDVQTASAHFERLKSTGARLAIEVRGRANDLLRNIDPFPFDEIKTGGAAILRFARTVRGPGLTAISDLLDIATKANAATTAVGVEDQASLSALRSLGFTAAQGNHLAKVGVLKNFRPARVNEVRELLGLDALSSEDLSALFRTQTPSPHSASQEEAKAEVEIAPVATDKISAPEVRDETEEQTQPEAKQTDFVETLQEGDAETDAEKPKAVNPAAGPTDAERKARAREKARAIAMAKRAKAIEARKAAAIERAKEKAAATSGDARPEGAAPSPRALQERLSKEFAGGPPKPAATSANAKAAPVRAPESDGTKAENAMASAKSQKTPQPDAPNEPLAKRTAAEKKPAPIARRKAPAPVAAPMLKTSMAVGAVNAYFQPGIQIAGLGEDSAPRAMAQTPVRQPTPSFSEPRQPMPAAPSIQEAPQQTTQKPAPQYREEVPSTTLFDDVPLGDLHNEHDDITRTYQKAVRHSPPKGFLSRTVIPFPTHFWPRPWKRRYLQWKAARAEKAQNA